MYTLLWLFVHSLLFENRVKEKPINYFALSYIGAIYFNLTKELNNLPQNQLV